MKTDQQATHRRILHLNGVIMISFLIVALALIYWSVLRAEAILAREDNPRLVEGELRILRGGIFDREETILAETSGEENQLTRRYSISDIGPAVGYYSFRHGTAGVEAGYDAILRGDTTSAAARLQQQLLHQPQVGADIRLTLDAAWQKTAASLLGDQKGAVILLQLPGQETGGTAQILSLVSHPDYDPNQLDDLFDDLVADESAPLLNRTTQGQYQPGLMLQPLLLAAASDKEIIHLDDVVEQPNRPVSLNGTIARCATRPPEPATWVDVLAHRCPGPMLDLAAVLTPADLDQIFADFGLTTSPDIPLNTDTPVVDPTVDTELAVIGQENLIVTPMQLALAWTALADDGRLPTPQLVTDVRDEMGDWLPEIITPTMATVVSPQAALDLRLALPHQENLLEYSVIVPSGPEGGTNTWYLGLTTAVSPRYAVITILEDSADLNLAEEIGRSLLTKTKQ